MALGLIPDMYFDMPLQALSTPGGPGPLGCIGCGVPGRFAGPTAEHLGLVMVDESPLGATTTGKLAIAGMVIGAGVGVVAGVVALRRRRRR